MTCLLDIILWWTDGLTKQTRQQPPQPSPLFIYICFPWVNGFQEWLFYCLFYRLDNLKVRINCKTIVQYDTLINKKCSKNICCMLTHDAFLYQYMGSYIANMLLHYIRLLYYKVFIIRFILLFVGIMDPVVIHFYEVYYRIFMLSLIFKWIKTNSFLKNLQNKQCQMVKWWLSIVWLN